MRIECTRCAMHCESEMPEIVDSFRAAHTHAPEDKRDEFAEIFENEKQPELGIVGFSGGIKTNAGALPAVFATPDMANASVWGGGCTSQTPLIHPKMNSHATKREWFRTELLNRIIQFDSDVTIGAALKFIKTCLDAFDEAHEDEGE